MKSFLIAACAVLFALAAPARAAEPPQFFLRPDGTVEQRVAAVESDVAKLRAEVAALTAKLNGESSVAAAPKSTSAPGCTCDNCQCCTACAGAASVSASTGHYERQRVGVFRSRNVWVSDAPQAVQTVQGATTFTLPGATLGSPCAGGSCPAPSRRR